MPKPKFYRLVDNEAEREHKENVLFENPIPPAVLAMAQQEAEEGRYFANLIYGNYPGWAYFDYKIQAPRAVLFAERQEKPMRWENVMRAMEDIEPVSDLGVLIRQAFNEGARSVEVRPMPEELGGKAG